MIEVLGSIHWHPTPEDPFDDLTIASEQCRDDEEAARECPPELRQTLDEYAAEQFFFSVEVVEPELLA